MNNNWFIAYIAREGTLAVFNLIPVKMLAVLIIGSILSAIFDPGVKEYKPIKTLTYDGLVRACRTELGLRGYTPKSLDRITSDRAIEMCKPNYPYTLVDDNGNVIEKNNHDKPQRQF
jgi:hypothetical protein